MAQIQYEMIFLGRDRWFGRILRENGVPVPDLSSITRIDLIIGAVTVTSTDPEAGEIRWGQPGYDPGEIRVFAGANADLQAAQALQMAWLVTYDSTNPDGFPWDSFPILILQV